MQQHGAWKKRSWALIMGTYLTTGCQSQPDPSLKRGATESASRDSFFQDKQNTDIVTSDQVAKDEKVKDLSNQVRTDPFNGCGYASVAAGNQVPLDPIQLKNPSSKVISGRVTIIGNGGLNVGGTLSTLKFNNVFNVVSASPNNATSAAMKAALKSSAATDFQAISQEDVQTALGATAEKPVCGVIMVRAQKSLAADNTTFVNASFDKPVIQMISPKLAVERIKLQLLNPVKISNVTARIETNDPDIQASGLVKKGEVEVTLIPAERSLTDSLGNAVTIKSEVAYRVTNKFVDATGNNNGQPSILDQVAEFYISDQKVTHMIVKTPRPDLPLIIYYPQ